MDVDQVGVRMLRQMFALATAAAIAITALPAAAQDKPLKKTRIVAATAVFDVTYPQLTLPLTLGYWKQEGYDVDIQPGGGSVQAIQQMVGGNADFAAGSGNAMIQFNVKNNLPIRIVYNYANTDWSIAVDADGPIKTVKDLKGKTIGVFNLATGGMGLLNALLRTNGLDPAKDVELIAVGMGAAPVEAMKSGKAQALMYWGSGTASFENAGLKLRKIIGPDWPGYPDYSLVTMQGTADKNPEMMIALGRGTAKAALFAITNPECAVRLHWKNYPGSRGTGDEAAALKRDLHSLGTQLESMVQAYKLFGHDKLWGKVDAVDWNRLSAFMLEAKQIDKPFDASQLVLKIPNFYEKVSDFDAEAVKAQARACKL